MNYQVRILQEGFVMGTQAFPKGSELEVISPVKDYMIREGIAELVEDDTGYTRRDMQASTKTTRRKRAPRKKAALQ